MKLFTWKGLCWFEKWYNFTRWLKITVISCCLLLSVVVLYICIIQNLVPNVELPPLCSSEIFPGPPSEKAQVLSQQVLEYVKKYDIEKILINFFTWKSCFFDS